MPTFMAVQLAALAVMCRCTVLAFEATSGGEAALYVIAALMAMAEYCAMTVSV